MENWFNCGLFFFTCCLVIGVAIGVLKGVVDIRQANKNTNEMQNMETISRLGQMKDKGYLTEEEFQERKRRILDDGKRR